MGNTVKISSTLLDHAARLRNWNRK